MLSDNWRLQFYNGTGASIDSVAIVVRGKYFDADGKLTLESSADITNDTSVATGNYGTSDVVDNGAKSNPCVEADIEVSIGISSGSPAGDVTVRLQKASSDTPDWPDDGSGGICAVINFAATGTKERNFSVS